MKAKLLHQDKERTFAVVFDKGDEAMAGLLAFAREHRVAGSYLTGIGAFSDVTLGFFARARKDYERIRLAEQVEVLSLLGDIALDPDGRAKIHAHIVVGRRDGTAHGGHLLEGHVWPTLEVIVVESPAHLRRQHDEETGLPLIRL